MGSKKHKKHKRERHEGEERMKIIYPGSLSDRDTFLSVVLQDHVLCDSCVDYFRARRFEFSSSSIVYSVCPILIERNSSLIVQS